MRKYEVGPERPESKIIRGSYTGDDTEMRGETAYMARCEGGWVIQADNILTTFGYGWWKFSFEEWRPID